MNRQLADNNGVTMTVLAQEGLNSRVRPILTDRASVASRLFSVQDRIERCASGLRLLEVSFDSTREDRLNDQDRRTYERELIRRKRRLDSLEKRRSRLMKDYGQELLDSRIVHPDISHLY